MIYLIQLMLVYENRSTKMIFFVVNDFFFMNYDFENECEN